MSTRQSTSPTYIGDTPSEAENIETGARNIVKRMAVSYPYKVVSQDSESGLVSLDPLIKIVAADGVISDLPSLVEVPVAYPAGGDYHLFFPLSAGDEGMVVVSSRSMSQWVESGDPEANPEGRRVSSLVDAVFFPGLRPRTNPRAELANGVLSIGSDSGTKEVVVIGAPVRVGSPTASNPVAKSVPVTTDLGKMVADNQQLVAILLTLGKSYVPTLTSVTANATSKLLAE